MSKPRTPDRTPSDSIASPELGVKPWPDFPLHWFKPRAKWRKKFRGKHYYFEADPIRSYDAWRKLEEDLLAGVALPRAAQDGRRGFELVDAVNAFLHYQHRRFEQHEIGNVQMGKYVKELKTELLKTLSGRTDLADFCDINRAPALFDKIRTAAIDRGYQAAERHITYVRAMFEYVSKPGANYLMSPPIYGDSFDKPTSAVIERARHQARMRTGDQTWTLDEASRLIHAAVRRDVHLYAQLVLMAVAGYTSADVAALPIAAVDRRRGVIDFPRVKNMRRRLCPLVPPLLVAIDASLKQRPTPADKAYAGLLFLTREGTPLNVTDVKRNAAGHVVGTKRKDTLNLRVRRLCETLDELEQEKPTAERVAPLKRAGQGQKIFRTLNYRAAIGAGVHDDFIAVLRGRRFSRPIEDYYLRGDLRSELEKLALHVAKAFGIPKAPPKSEGTLRYRGGRGKRANKAQGAAGSATNGVVSRRRRQAVRVRSASAASPAPSTD